MRLCSSVRAAVRLCALLVLFNLAATGSAQPIRFAVIGDYGSSGAPNSPTAHVAAMVASWNPDFVVTVGDNMYGNTRTEWGLLVGRHYGRFILRDAQQPARFPEQTSPIQRFFPAVGNHDAAGDDITGYEEYFHHAAGGAGRLPAGTDQRAVHTSMADYYDFVRGPVHFFILDSHHAKSHAEVMQAQRRWLQETLAADTASKWKVVAMHHPAYSSASHGSDPAMQWPFREWGATAVLQGHDHSYERLLQDGLPYFVNGAGGAGLYGFRTPPESSSQFRFQASHGAMLVTADNHQMEFTFHAVDGHGNASLQDRFVQRETPRRALAKTTVAPRNAGRS